MSIKISSVTKKEFKNGNTDNYYHIKISGKDINHVLVNTLRRVSLDLIPVHAFNSKDTNIKLNTSVYNNDQIRLKLSILPIYEIDNNITLIDEINNIQMNNFTENSLDKLQIFFQKKNDGKDLMYFTTDDCKFYKGGKKIESIYKRPVLIVPLQPGQMIEGDCKSSIGIGLHNGIYRAVQICCYEELSENEYLFKIETRGELKEPEILRRACLIVENKIKLLKEKFSSKEIEGTELELSLINEDHTLGNLLTYYLQEHKSVVYAGYKIDHPLQIPKEVNITIKSNGSKKMKTIILDTFDLIESKFKLLRNKLK